MPVPSTLTAEARARKCSCPSIPTDLGSPDLAGGPAHPALPGGARAAQAMGQ